MGAAIDLSEQQFGRLTALRRIHGRHGEKIRWVCRCQCGNEKIVCGGHLRTNKISSCGCLRSETTAEKNTTHGMGRLAEYEVWCGMIRRCENSKRKEWPNYGGRGVTVCERWRNDFVAFLADMGRRPSPKHSLDRFPNNDGNYEPRNCRWATSSQQALNRRPKGATR